MQEENDDQRFSARLRAVMEDRDISNADLARTLGVTEETVSRWRNAERVLPPSNPRIDTPSSHLPDLLGMVSFPARWAATLQPTAA